SKIVVFDVRQLRSCRWWTAGVQAIQNVGSGASRHCPNSVGARVTVVRRDIIWKAISNSANGYLFNAIVQTLYLLNGSDAWTPLDLSGTGETFGGSKGSPPF